MAAPAAAAAAAAAAANIEQQQQDEDSEALALELERALEEEEGVEDGGGFNDDGGDGWDEGEEEQQDGAGQHKKRPALGKGARWYGRGCLTADWVGWWVGASFDRLIHQIDQLTFDTHLHPYAQIGEAALKSDDPSTPAPATAAPDRRLSPYASGGPPSPLAALLPDEVIYCFWKDRCCCIHTNKIHWQPNHNSISIPSRIYILYTRSTKSTIQPKLPPKNTGASPHRGLRRHGPGTARAGLPPVAERACARYVIVFMLVGSGENVVYVWYFLLVGFDCKCYCVFGGFVSLVGLGV